MDNKDEARGKPTSGELACADQATAALADLYPKFWWRMFNELLDVGFHREDAMSLLQTHITTSCRRIQ